MDVVVRCIAADNLEAFLGTIGVDLTTQSAGVWLYTFRAGEISQKVSRR